MEELRKCIKGFRNNKASGLDNIPVEPGRQMPLTHNFLKSATKL
jgi:hypothetical protein